MHHSGIFIRGDTLKPPFAKPYDFALANNSRTFTDLLTPRCPEGHQSLRRRHRPWKAHLLPARQQDANGVGLTDERDCVLLPPTPVVKDAHAAACSCTPSPSVARPNA